MLLENLAETRHVEFDKVDKEDQLFASTNVVTVLCLGITILASTPQVRQTPGKFSLFLLKEDHLRALVA
jgi:hypothetical protein